MILLLRASQGAPSCGMDVSAYFFLDCIICRPYFIPSASHPSDNFVGFGLSFAKCERDCCPSQNCLVSLMGLKIKIKCMAALGLGRVYRVDCY